MVGQRADQQIVELLGAPTTAEIGTLAAGQ
jgi:hypothetical protein